MAAWSFTHGDTLSEAADADADGAAPALIGRDGSRCADAGRDHRHALLPACRRSTLSAPADSSATETGAADAASTMRLLPRRSSRGGCCCEYKQL